MTYSIEFRKKILSIKEQEKLTFSEVSKRYSYQYERAARFGVSPPGIAYA